MFCQTYIPYFILFSFLLSASSLAQDGWKWQNPLPQGNDLYDVWVLDSLTVIATGEYGTIIRTIDGGQSWTVSNVDSSMRLYSLWFANFQTGWFVGSDDDNTAYIFKTTDGGESWLRYSVGNSNRSVNSLCFPSDSVGYLVGDNGLSYKSIDGGESWNDLSLSPNSSNTMTDVYFVSDSLGWAVGLGGLIRTTKDGGQSWNNIVQSGIRVFSSVHFLNADTGWVGGMTSGNRGIIMRTGNGGVEWRKQFVSSSENVILDLFFVTPDSGWGTTADGQVISTTNGGNSWSERETGTTQPLGGIHFSDWRFGYAVGRLAYVFRSNNGGQDWYELSEGERTSFYDILMSNESYGWAVGEGGVVLKTNDGGHSWLSLVVGGDSFAWTRIIQSGNLTVLLGYRDSGTFLTEGAVAKSTDMGNSWTIETYPTIYGILGGEFVTEQIGWILAWHEYDRYLWKTSDGGVTWQEQIADTGGCQLNSLDFLTQDLGWVACGTGKEVFRTATGGSSWDTLRLVQTPVLEIEDITFVTETQGWFCGGLEVFGDAADPSGGEGYIYSTSDGGESWSLQDSIMRDAYTAISFSDAKHGRAVGYRGFYAMTDDGGKDWKHLDSGTGRTFYGVQFVSDSKGWIVGENGTILFTETSGLTIGGSTEQTPFLLGQEFKLLSNYPNPFNSKTRISFSLQRSAYISLNVYNVLGQKVAKLSVGYYPSGTHEVQWEGLDDRNVPVSSGIYIVVLFIHKYDLQLTDKIVLIR